MSVTNFCSKSLKQALLDLGLSGAYVGFLESNCGQDLYIEIIFPNIDRDAVLSRLGEVENYRICATERKTVENYFVVRISKPVINISLLSLLLLARLAK